MKSQEYWARIRRIPLHIDRDTADGEAMICRQNDGTPVRVTKPEYFTDEEHEAVLEYYEMMYGSGFQN